MRSAGAQGGRHWRASQGVPSAPAHQRTSVRRAGRKSDRPYSAGSAGSVQGGGADLVLQVGWAPQAPGAEPRAQTRPQTCMYDRGTWSVVVHRLRASPRVCRFRARTYAEGTTTGPHARRAIPSMHAPGASWADRRPTPDNSQQTMDGAQRTAICPRLQWFAARGGMRGARESPWQRIPGRG